MAAVEGRRGTIRRGVAAGMAASLLLAGCVAGGSEGPRNSPSATETQQRVTARVTLGPSPVWTDPELGSRQVVSLPAAECTRSDLSAVPTFSGDANPSFAPDPAIEAALPRTILGQRIETVSTHGDTPALGAQPFVFATMLAACLHAPYAGLSVGIAYVSDPTGPLSNLGTPMVEAVRLAGRSGAELEKGFYGALAAEASEPSSGYEGSVGGRTYHLYTPGTPAEALWPTIGTYPNADTVYLVYFFSPCCPGAGGTTTPLGASPTPRPPSLERFVRDVVAQVP